MRYLVLKGAQWRDFCTYGKEGQTLAAADLKADGQPLPAAVLARLIAAGCLLPVEGD